MDLYNRGARQLLELRFTHHCCDIAQERDASTPSSGTATCISALFPFILCSTVTPMDFQKDEEVVQLQLQNVLLPDTEKQHQLNSPWVADGTGGEGATQAEKQILGDQQLC